MSPDTRTRDSCYVSRRLKETRAVSVNAVTTNDLPTIERGKTVDERHSLQCFSATAHLGLRQGFKDHPEIDFKGETCDEEAPMRIFSKAVLRCHPAFSLRFVRSSPATRSSKVLRRYSPASFPKHSFTKLKQSYRSRAVLANIHSISDSCCKHLFFRVACSLHKSSLPPNSLSSCDTTQHLSKVLKLTPKAPLNHFSPNPYKSS